MTEHFLEELPPKQPDRFDRFTVRARRILSFATEEAVTRSHSYVDTEHVLLGLLRDPDCFGVTVLANLGIDSEQLLKIVEASMANRESSSEVGLTAATKTVISLSVDEAKRLDHRYLGTEHLVLGLVRENDGIAAKTLQGLGIDLDRTRAEIIRTLTPQNFPIWKPLTDMPPVGSLSSSGPEHHYWSSTLQQWRNFLLGSDQQTRERYGTLLNDLLQQAQQEHNTPPENI